MATLARLDPNVLANGHDFPETSPQWRIAFPVAALIMIALAVILAYGWRVSELYLVGNAAGVTASLAFLYRLDPASLLAIGVLAVRAWLAKVTVRTVNNGNDGWQRSGDACVCRIAISAG